MCRFVTVAAGPNALMAVGPVSAALPQRSGREGQRDGRRLHRGARVGQSLAGLEHLRVGQQHRRDRTHAVTVGLQRHGSSGPQLLRRLFSGQRAARRVLRHHDLLHRLLTYAVQPGPRGFHPLLRLQLHQVAQAAVEDRHRNADEGAGAVAAVRHVERRRLQADAGQGGAQVGVVE